MTDDPAAGVGRSCLSSFGDLQGRDGQAANHDPRRRAGDVNSRTASIRRRASGLSGRHRSAAGAQEVTLAELAQLRQAATDLHRRITDDLARLASIDLLSEHDERGAAQASGWAVPAAG
ncbi:hypothetical protein [Amycolatopsis sp. DG1A-15b]|uniref:hypothetical protein n=1 Tax=Amycolatopsis sp. DG1A-15b TaxID=3052846 RepID=UPI00255BBAD6|nr:hypothetical protein [Amycolatopsis sp. DG1A-15b]WIX92441.1 hypothetical protein QRY02_19180 [Amycolatopsis sp. DG1A-15b]